MKFRTLIIYVLLSSSISVCAATGEPYQNLVIQKITVHIENQAPSDVDETQAVLHRLQTREGETFDQEAFDRDLKNLSDEFDWVEPRIKVDNHQVFISLDIKKRPTIERFEIEGSSFKKNKILREGELKQGMTYQRDNFYQSIHKIRDFYVKKGYFRVAISYTIDQIPNTNEIAVTLNISEGPKGKIDKIVYKGFTKDEQGEVSNLIRTREYSHLMSWLTGRGIIKEEEFAHDTQMIVNHLQNKGYVDAHVSMRLEEKNEYPGNTMLVLLITLDRGEKYNIHNVTFSGEQLLEEDNLKKAAALKEGDVFSIDKIRAAQEKIKELYTKDGYLHTNVDYTLTLLPDSHEYDINFNVEESEQFRVGLVMVSGNYCTTKNVVYNNLDIEPGEVLDSRKLKSTQRRLQSTGYFKNVNVYPVKCEENVLKNEDFCDVMVEVNEAQTGNMSLFLGASSTDNVFGGIDLTENNFNIAGFRDVWNEGIPAFRGGGQYFQAKAQVGAKETDAGFTWMNPYLNDTLWRLSVDFNYNYNKIISSNYRIHTLGGALALRYPLSPHFSYGYRFRVRDAVTRVHTFPQDPAQVQQSVAKEAIEKNWSPAQTEQELQKKLVEAAELREELLKLQKNNGIISGFALVAGYDTTDNALRPHRGFRSNGEAELAGVVHSSDFVPGGFTQLQDFPFLKFGYLNSFYYPIWARGTFKARADFKFIQPLMNGRFEDFPIPERFFLGGEGTVRGYAPGKIGPSYPNKKGEENSQNPTGGFSSALFSAEYLQNIAKPLDAFVFFDSGMITPNVFSFEKLYMSAGVGLRLDIGRQLPVIVGVGFPINPDNENQVQKVFFSMAGEF